MSKKMLSESQLMYRRAKDLKSKYNGNVKNPSYQREKRYVDSFFKEKKVESGRPIVYERHYTKTVKSLRTISPEVVDENFFGDFEDDK